MINNNRKCYYKYVSAIQRLALLSLLLLVLQLQIQVVVSDESYNTIDIDVDIDDNNNNNVHNDNDDVVTSTPSGIINTETIVVDERIKRQYTNQILFGHVGDIDNNDIDNEEKQIQQQEEDLIESNTIQLQEKIEKQRLDEILFGQVGDNDIDIQQVHDEEQQQQQQQQDNLYNNDDGKVDDDNNNNNNNNNSDNDNYNDSDNLINDSIDADDDNNINNNKDDDDNNDFDTLIPTNISLDKLQLAIDTELYNWMTGDTTKLKKYNRNILLQKQKQLLSSNSVKKNNPIIITLFWIVFIVDTDDCSTEYYTNIVYNKTFTTVVSNIQKRLQIQNNELNKNDQQPIPYYAKVQLTKQQSSTTDDTEILFHRFGIQTTPTIVVVVSDIIFDNTDHNQQQTTSTTVTPLIVGEYKGVTHTNVNLMTESIIRSYYYYTYLTSLVLTTSTDNNKNTNEKNNDITSQYVRKVRSFSSLQDISYLLYNHRTNLLLPELLLSIKNSVRQSLSLTLPVVERIYIEYLMGWDDYSIKKTKENEYNTNSNNNATNSTNGRTNMNANITILVQHRCSSSHYDDTSSSAGSSSTNTLNYNTLYTTFDTMGQILSHRQDLLFFVIQQDSTDTSCHSLDGDITVYSIPSIQLFLNDNDDTDRDDIDHNYFKNTNWISDYIIPNVQFDPNQYIPSNQQCYVVSESNDDESDIKKNTNECNVNDSNDEDVTITKREKTTTKNEMNITLYVHSRLHEFLIKVATPMNNNNNNVFWFDHESTSPILFSNGRHVHAILFINMHHTILRTLIEQELYSTESYNDNEAKELIVSILQNDKITKQMKYTIQQFQSLCSQHYQNNMYNNNTTNSFITNDMVCMVIPSTETRILTTFGIDYWSIVDDIAYKAAAGEDVDNNNESSNSIFPTLVITDQRNSIGTKRHYLDLAISSTTLMSTTTSSPTPFSFEEEYEKQYTIMSNFITNFWQGTLQPDVRSDNRGTRVNKSGVRIITSQTAVVELFGDNTTTTTTDSTSTTEGSNEDQTNNVQQQQQHDVTKLLLLVAPTCGHCKRISALWNEMSKFLHSIGWNTFIQLYRIDVTTNDIEVSLNLTSNWLPDVFYVVPSNNYNYNNNINYNNNTSSASSYEQQRSTQPRHFIRYLQSPNVDTDMNGGDDGIGTIHDFTEILEWLLFDILEDDTINKTTSILTDTTLRQLYSKLKE